MSEPQPPQAFRDLKYEDLVELVNAHEPEGTRENPVAWPVGPRMWDYLREAGMPESGLLFGGTVRVFIPRRMPSAR